ncbi:HlyD family type I secretion periplasmic adaptor subunit [Ochrobactrum quorumnocens]|uniref:Membrane fusion protein (MFP) family protein n=1 Tax=Ochrobactrum quorumnocens TaxID=271865 RepID=A0A5N1JQD8_9HYPH|nr:HlyD family type I secretion periplasmic adaptor subunit [[Ochrobactrum] quorumnocens]KAA9361434.1 HlyD family type I secretion periplasmic adaptor subunit [[Ochrobactrum] quorumnocens]
MNVVNRLKKGKIPRQLRNPSRNRQDMAFLPAALEILETPASPIRIAFVWFICVLVVTALLWGWFGKFDIVATAQGKIQPTGRVKIIESLENGKTKAVPVRNGDRVKAGEVLVALDDAEIKAEETAKLAMLHAFKAEVVRRTSLLGVIEAWQQQRLWTGIDSSTSISLVLPEKIPTSMRLREEVVFRADLHGIKASLASLAAQRSQRQAEIAGLNGSIRAQATLVATLNERVSMRTKLVQSASGSRAHLIDAMQDYQEAASALADKQGQLKAAEAALEVATAEGIKLLQTAASDNANRKLEALRRIDELEQEVIKARTRRNLMTILSPINGTVQLSSITTIDQVIASGTELMRIVPSDATLEIEAFLPNKDIGFVAAGQSAIIKVEAYPFTRFGLMEGKVIRVSSDAIPEPDAQQMESTITKNARSTIPTGNVPRVQNLVFPVNVGLNKTTLMAEGRDMPVTSGMSVTVEITTGKRRVLEYIFSPIAQIASEAMGER